MKHTVLISICAILFAPAVWAENFGSEGYSVDLGAGASYVESELEGQGFAGNLPSTQGLTYGLTLSRGWAKNGTKLNLHYNYADADLEGPTTVTPRDINVKRSEYGLSFLASVGESFLGSFRYGLGYRV